MCGVGFAVMKRYCRWAEFLLGCSLFYSQEYGGDDYGGEEEKWEYGRVDVAGEVMGPGKNRWRKAYVGDRSPKILPRRTGPEIFTQP